MATLKYKVGVGGHYTDFNDVVAALVAIGPGGLTDDYEFEFISNVTNTTAVSGGVVYLNYHTVKFCSSVPHYGNPTIGNLITCVTTPTIYTAQPATGRGILIFEDLYFKAAPTLGTNVVWFQIAMELFAFLTWKDRKCIIRNCMFDGNGVAQTALQCASAEYSYWLLSNLKIWGHTGYGLRFGWSGVAPNPGETTKIIENVTVFNEIGGATGVYSNGLGDSGGDDTDYKNVISCRSGVVGTDWYSGMLATRCVVDNCASSDATCPVTFGSNNLQNIVTVDEFESLDDTNPDFLSLKKGALAVNATANPDRGLAPLKVQFGGDIKYVWPAGMQLYNGGAVPSLGVLDIAGTPYGKYGDYPIGCHNAEIAY